MVRSEMKNYNTTLTEKLQKDEKLINVNMLQAKKYYVLIKVEL